MAMVAGPQFKVDHLPVALAEAVVAVYLSLYLLIVGKKLLNQRNTTMKWIADSSYWVYLAHMPILLMVQFWLADIEMNMWFKFLISCVATFGIGFISYLVLVRWTALGWMLSGRNKL